MVSNELYLLTLHINILVNTIECFIYICISKYNNIFIYILRMAYMYAFKVIIIIFT